MISQMKNSRQDMSLTQDTDLINFNLSTTFEQNRSYYDGFAFRDRITHSKIKYKEARCSQGLAFHQWKTKNQSISNNKQNLKNSLKIYKYTKQFQINCMRKKYFKHIDSAIKKPQDQYLNQATSLEKYRKDREKQNDLYLRSKTELQKILNNRSLRVDQRLIEEINQKSYRKNIKKPKESSQHQVKIKQIVNTNYITPAQAKITDILLNHMKSEIKNNAEYLLNVPLSKKKKHLLLSKICSENRRNLEKQNLNQTANTIQFINQLNQCNFSKIESKEILKMTHLATEHQQSVVKKEDKQIIKLIKNNFIHELEIQLTDHPELYQAADQYRNNILHIAVKTGNIQTLNFLLRKLTPQSFYQLMLSKNKLKKTPKQQAKILGFRQIQQNLKNFEEQYEKILKSQ